MNHVGDLDRALLDYLSRSAGFVNAAEVAAALGTSTKTIYRHIDQINEQSDEPVIQTIRGKGARLLPSALPDLSSSNEQMDSASQSSLERRNQVLEQLLFRAPVKMSLDDLYTEQYVSDATIDNDLLYLKRRLAKKSWCLYGPVIPFISKAKKHEFVNNSVRFCKTCPRLPLAARLKALQITTSNSSQDRYK